MASTRTFVTELATALGMLGPATLDEVIAGGRPPALVNLADDDWEKLAELWTAGSHRDDFVAGFGNGQAFLHARDALAGRRPTRIEWTGARRAPGDEVVPSDLRVDHVYLVSCKYLSRILGNPSPARLVEGLLAQSPVDDRRDWYQRVAPAEHQALFEACREPLVDAGIADLPARVEELDRDQRRGVAKALRGAWPSPARGPYRRLCEVVAEITANEWRRRIDARTSEPMLWRLLRIGSAPYFILGASDRGSMRLRIDTPWDWRQMYRLVRFDIAAQAGGQPRVGWRAQYEVRASREERVVEGHVEIRWSHGRFGQPPEAKVYLDTPHTDVPGYHPLCDDAEPSLLDL